MCVCTMSIGALAVNGQQDAGQRTGENMRESTLLFTPPNICTLPQGLSETDTRVSSTQMYGTAGGPRLHSLKRSHNDIKQGGQGGPNKFSCTHSLNQKAPRNEYIALTL